MFKIDVKNVITLLVEHERKTWDEPVWNEDGTITKDGVSMEISYTVNDPSSGESVTKNIFILFCGNTNVFYAYKASSAFYPSWIPLSSWKNSSNHDSCWRSDGLSFIINDYFQMCWQVNHGGAPVDLESNCYFHWGTPIKKVKITYKQDNDNYQNQITKVEMI